MKIIKLFNKKSSNQSLDTFLNKMNNSNFNDDLLNDFNNKVDSFLSKNNIDEYDDFIQYNYLHFLYLYKYQRNSPDGRSKYTLKEFLHVCLRILELYFFIINKELTYLATKFFSINNYDDCIYTHFKNISAKIENDDIRIQYLKDNSDPQVFLNDEHYKSSSMPIITEVCSDNYTHFNQIFKLDNTQVQAIFSARLSINNENKIGGKGNLSKRAELDKHIFSNEDIFSNRSIGKKSSKEMKLDFHNTNIQRTSAIFKNYNLTSEPINTYDTDSSYKKHLINKAISTQLTKKSMYLVSTYSFPHISQLKLLVNLLQNNEDINKCLILCSMFTAISIKNLIYAFLNIHNKLEYQSRRKIFQAKIPKDIYSSKASETVHIQLNDELEKITSVLHEYYKNEKINLEDSTVDSFIDEELKKAKETLNQSLKKLDKTTKLTFNNLHNCLRFYFNQFHKNSDISILFHINIDQSDKAKACYIQQPARLTNLENWIHEFYLILTDKNTTLKVIEKEKEIGSSFFIRSKDFKNFIDDLDNLYLRNNDPIIKFNLQMIFIRYSLSLLLATRDYKNSCELYSFSKMLKILTIQEKAKNLKTAKRILPLSNLAVRIINLFYSLKNSSTDFKSYSPMLLREGKIEEINTENVKAYLSTICTPIEQDRIAFFLNKCKLNFGRHVFSTLIRRENIKKDYENAFLGHFFLGNTDQGIYSNFDNLDYHSEIVNLIDNQITKDYLPSKIFMLEGK